MYTITPNINDVIVCRIATTASNGQTRCSRIKPGTYTETELITAFNNATGARYYWFGNQYFDSAGRKLGDDAGANIPGVKLVYDSDKHMLTFQSGGGHEQFYFVNTVNSFTNCPFFANVVTFFIPLCTIQSILETQTFEHQLRYYEYPDSTVTCIKNPTSSTVSLTWGSNTVSIDPLGYYIVPDIESKTIINNVITDVFTIDSNTCVIQDPTHIFNYNPGYDTAVNYNYLTLTSVNMIYVNEPIKIIDTENNNNGQISIPYGLYSYNQFWKYLSTSYDQYLFYTSSPDRTIAYSTNENNSFTLSYQINKIGDDIECNSSLDIILNKVKDYDNEIVVSTFDNYFEISSVNNKSFKLAEPWKYNIFLISNSAYSFVSFNKNCGGGCKSMIILQLKIRLQYPLNIRQLQILLFVYQLYLL